MYALNASTGAKLWSFATGDNRFPPLPAAANGMVYIGSADGHVYALNGGTGAKLWSFATGEGPLPQVANGVVYVGSNDGNVYALNASSGAKLWSFDDGVVPVGPLVVANGVVYVSCSPGLCAVNASTGGLMWGTDPAFGGLAAVANGVVYTLSSNSVFALDGDTGIKLWELFRAQRYGSASPISPGLPLWMGRFTSALQQTSMINLPILVQEALFTRFPWEPICSCG